MFNFSGQTVMVSGATGNLGRAVAHAFKAADANLVLIDRGRDRLAKQYPELQASPKAHFANEVDATDPHAVAAAVTAAVERFGRLDVLVNTVGSYRGGKPLAEAPQEDWDFLMQINARSMLVPTRAVVPRMLEQGSGKIISVAARAGLTGASKQGMYSASKSAVIRLTEALAAELRDANINVNCVLPGTIDTPENREQLPKSDFSRWVLPEAIADVILFLASDAARAVQGAAVPVYGRS
jgi:NAD(P)-dependent dehydrogenase (short-subunit alcohol dehydrogenase family)